MLKFFYTQIFTLPTRLTLNLFWNFGSFLGVFIIFQVLRGFFIIFFYTPSVELSFFSVQYIIFEVNRGWFFRLFHINGSSILFFFLYLHFFKALYLNRFKLKKVWLRGLLMLILLIGIAFIGYSLVFSQMRYWAIVVITSLISTIPVLGEIILIWIWGGFRVGAGVLKLFFSLHFILPFALLLVIFLHLLMLHRSGRTSHLNYSGDTYKYVFNPFYRVKDMYNLFWITIIFIFLIIFPYVFGDRELFIEANSMVSPVHIAPEWYFCAFYAVLRSIPNKVLGVVAIGITLVDLGVLSLLNRRITINKFYINILVSFFVLNFIMLGWLGLSVAEDPFISLSFWGMVFYFLLLIILKQLKYNFVF